MGSAKQSHHRNQQSAHLSRITNVMLIRTVTKKIKCVVQEDVQGLVRPELRVSHSNIIIMIIIISY